MRQQGEAICLHAVRKRQVNKQKERAIPQRASYLSVQQLLRGVNEPRKKVFQTCFLYRARKSGQQPGHTQKKQSMYSRCCIRDLWNCR